MARASGEARPAVDLPEFTTGAPWGLDRPFVWAVYLIVAAVLWVVIALAFLPWVRRSPPSH